MKKVKLANPITGHANQLASFFSKDKDVTCKFDFSHRKLKLYVSKADKAIALAAFLKDRIKLGNLWLDVVVYPPNGDKRLVPEDMSKIHNDASACVKLVKTAFKGNKNYSRCLCATDRTDTVWVFALFGRQACTWANDDMQNPELVTSALPEDIVKTFFDTKGIQVSTEPGRVWTDLRK